MDQTIESRYQRVSSRWWIQAYHRLLLSPEGVLRFFRDTGAALEPLPAPEAPVPPLRARRLIEALEQERREQGVGRNRQSGRNPEQAIRMREYWRSAQQAHRLSKNRKGIGD